jgi:hypothetical protein
VWHSIALLLVLGHGIVAGPTVARGEEAPEIGAESRLEQYLSRDWALGPGPARYPYHLDVWGPPLLMALGMGIVELVLEPPRSPRWTGTSAFDDEARDALVAGSASARDDADLVSSGLFGALGVAVAADRWQGRSRTPFLRGVASDTTWFFANGVATGIAKVAAGRERPYVEPCELNPNHFKVCDSGRDDNASFYSGHASGAATLAGRLCSRHPDLLSWDGLWCVGGIGTAVASGFLRITADEHYATDVITGWASGALFGYVLPRYFDVEPDPLRDIDEFLEPERNLRALSPMVSPGTLGLRYEIRF